MRTVAFCTCANQACGRNPANHDQGCTPCIELNLALKKIPSCFFNIVDPSGMHKGFDFAEFARIVAENQASAQKE